MSKKSAEALLSPVKQLYQKSAFPVFLADETLDTLWTNKTFEQTQITHENAFPFLNHITENRTHLVEKLKEDGQLLTIDTDVLSLYPAVTLMPLTTEDGALFAVLCIPTAANTSEKELIKLAEATTNRIREPLTTSFPIAENLARILESAGLSDALDALSYLTRNNLRILKYADSFLKYAKLSVNSEPFLTEPINLGYFVEELFSSVQSVLPERKIYYQNKAQTPHVLLHKDLFRTAFFSVLSNALEEETVVTLTLEETYRSVLLTIRDNGKGMSEKKVLSLLELDFLGTDSYGDGTDFHIGLPLAKQIMTAHGGQLRVVSAIDSGTSVIFSLPKTNLLPSITHAQTTSSYLKNKLSPTYVYLSDLYLKLY